MSWDDFRIFLAVAETGSLRAAAEQLKVNHSTVSRRLSAFEHRARAKLLIRRSDGYRLTPSGEEIARSATRMRDEVIALDQNTFGQNDAMAGEVRFALPAFLAEHLLVAELNIFQDRYPRINVTMPTETLQNHPDVLSRCEADVAVRLTNNPQERLIGRKVARYAYALYASVDYLERVDPTRDDITLLTDARSDYATHWSSQIGLDPGKATIRRIDDCGVRHVATRQGTGFGILPCFAADQDPLLRRVKDCQPVLHSDIWILTHAELRKVARVRALIDHLAHSLRGHRELLEGTRPWRDAIPTPRVGVTRAFVKEETFLTH